MDKETWELLIKSFKKDPNRKPSYLVILNGIEYELIYNVEPYGKFTEGILIKDKKSGYLIGTIYKDFFSDRSDLDTIQYKENDTLINIIDRMKYYNNKREEERKEEIERREKKLDSFLYGDG